MVATITTAPPSYSAHLAYKACASAGKEHVAGNGQRHAATPRGAADGGNRRLAEIVTPAQAWWCPNHNVPRHSSDPRRSKAANLQLVRSVFARCPWCAAGVALSYSIRKISLCYPLSQLRHFGMLATPSILCVSIF